MNDYFEKSVILELVLFDKKFQKNWFFIMINLHLHKIGNEKIYSKKINQTLRINLVET